MLKDYLYEFTHFFLNPLRLKPVGQLISNGIQFIETDPTPPIIWQAWMKSSANRYELSKTQTCLINSMGALYDRRHILSKNLLSQEVRLEDYICRIILTPIEVTK